MSLKDDRIGAENSPKEPDIIIEGYPFTDVSPGSTTPESTVRGSGSEGYLGDNDDCDISTMYDEDSEEEGRLLSVSTGKTGRSSSIPSSRTSLSPSRPSVFQEASSLSSTRKFLFGIFIVVVISVSWVISTQTAQSTYDGKFNSPFFLVWFGTSCMVFVFPITVPFYFIMNRVCVNGQNIKKLYRHSTEIITSNPFSPLAILTSAVLFTCIWTPTNYLYVRALTVIPATDVTAIFSTAPAFVFILSMIILREPPLLLRFVAVVLAVGGIVLFAFVNGFGATTVEGVLMSVGSAMGAALYKTLLKWRVKEASLYQMSLFVSSIGALNLLVLWPVVVILQMTGVEVLLEIPWLYLACHSVAGVIFNFAINFGIAYTFPLFISLGTIIGVPLNALFDAFVRHVDLLNWKITAMDLIIGGFLLILVPPTVSRTLERLLTCNYCCGKCSRCRHRNNNHVNN